MRKIVIIVACLFLASGCASHRKANLLRDGAELKPCGVQEEGVWVPPKIQKIWVASHVDPDTGDFIEGYYKHSVVEEGHWKLQEEPPVQRKR